MGAALRALPRDEPKGIRRNMSYSIYIGEAIIETPAKEDQDECNAIDVTVAEFRHPEAPAFSGDALTNNSNGRHPGYGQWAGFLREVGLYDLFFGAQAHTATRKKSLMSEHPGAALLTKSDLKEIQAALKRWQKRTWRTKERIPGWDPEHNPFSKKEADPRYDGNLARLIWLEWWVTWALANCKVPTLYNY